MVELQPLEYEALILLLGEERLDHVTNCRDQDEFLMRLDAELSPAELRWYRQQRQPLIAR